MADLRSPSMVTLAVETLCITALFSFMKIVDCANVQIIRLTSNILVNFGKIKSFIFKTIQ